MAIMPQQSLFSWEDVEQLKDPERARKLRARLKKRHPEVLAAGIGPKGGMLRGGQGRVRLPGTPMAFRGLCGTRRRPAPAALLAG